MGTTKKPPHTLTPKQERFAAEYLIDLNATQAAIRAGYSPKTAQEQASRLLSNVMVQKAVAAGREARAARTKIDADWVLRRLKEEAEATGDGTSHSARVKALEILCKHLGLLADETINLNLRGNTDTRPVEELTDAELNAILAQGLQR